MPLLKPDICFVYGTLRRGLGNHRVMEKAQGKFLGVATSVRPFPLVVSGLPYLLDYPGKGHCVEGELYRVSEYGWTMLDRLEGHPHFYCRRVEEFCLGKDSVEAWVYFLARDDSALRHLPPVRSFSERTVDAC